MKVICPKVNGKFTDLYNCKNSIFLAGPCPRENYEEDWRNEAIDYLKDKNVTILNPTNEEYEDDFENQCEWEWKALRIASVIVFWIPRDKKHPAFTSNVEFGEWMHSSNVVFGSPEGAIKNEYLIHRFVTETKNPIYHTLKETLDAAISLLERKGTYYFTSDTHFGQQRTLELSRRPFNSVDDMDFSMISNWNKNVTCNDIVVHAGDFGDIDKLDWYLSNLNFKELKWVLGNYDREKVNEIKEVLKAYPNVTILNSLQLLSHGINFIVTHEPCNKVVSSAQKDIPNVVLFGHIHGRNFAKRNGFDLGIDYHGYKPISLEQVLWFQNAMQYWDEIVHCDRIDIC